MYLLSTDPGFSTCQDNEFKCLNNKCIQSDLKCDGEDNCGDNSDEGYVCKGNVLLH